MSIKIYVKYVKNKRDFYTTKMNLPTGALDSKTGEEVMECFLKLKEQGKTIIIVTHDEKVGSMCQRIIRLKDGNIIN